MWGAIASVAGGALGLLGSNRAANAQQSAARDAASVARETRDMTRRDLQPYAGAGQNALAAYLYEMGLGPAPSMGAPTVETISGAPRQVGLDHIKREGEGLRVVPRMSEATPDTYRVGGRTFTDMGEAQAFADSQGATYQGFTGTPGYQFRMDEGRNALLANQAVGGRLMSGSTGRALTQFGQDYASSEYGNYMNRLAGLAGSGQNAAAGMGAANQAYGNMATNAINAGGNAAAAGWMGGTNAVTNALGQYAGYRTMNQLLPQGFY